MKDTKELIQTLFIALVAAIFAGVISNLLNSILL